MKTQVKEITQTIELLNTKPKRRKSYIALLIISIICFLLMTVSGVLFAMTNKTIDNELLYSIYFGLTIGFCTILFFCLFARLCLTYKFKWTTIGIWNLIISIIVLCLLLCLVALYSLDYFQIITFDYLQLINPSKNMIETDTIIKFCFFAMVIIYTILTFLALCFMCGFDFVYVLHGQYAPSLATKKRVYSENKKIKAANKLTKARNKENSVENKKIKLNRNEKRVLAGKKRQAKINAKLAKKQTNKQAKINAKLAKKQTNKQAKINAKLAKKQTNKQAKINAKLAKKQTNKQAKINAKLAKKQIKKSVSSKPIAIKKQKSTKKIVKVANIKPAVVTTKATPIIAKTVQTKKSVSSKPIAIKKQKSTKKIVKVANIKPAVVTTKATPIIAKTVQTKKSVSSKPIAIKKQKSTKKIVMDKPIILNDQQVIITFDKKLGMEQINKQIGKLEKSLGVDTPKSAKESGIKIEKNN